MEARKWPYIERRRGYRTAVAIPVEIHAGRDFSVQSTRDLSVGGVYFDRAIPYAVGSRVAIHFTLPGEPGIIHCLGEVVNVPRGNAYGMGVRFFAVSPGDERKIESFVRDVEACRAA